MADRREGNCHAEPWVNRSIKLLSLVVSEIPITSSALHRGDHKVKSHSCEVAYLCTWQCKFLSETNYAWQVFDSRALVLDSPDAIACGRRD